MKLSRLKQPRMLVALLWMLLGSTGLLAQVTISGTVTAADSGEPLIGANIVVQGTTTGATTDVDGTYTLEIPNANAVLEVSYIGYQTLTVNVGGRTVVDIAMQADAGLLEEVVVIGYGTQRKSDLTGAVTSVEGEDLARIPTASVQQALQGKVPGVQVVNTSGRPGEGAVVRIRGIGTLNNANPLYVVDGVILPSDSDLNSIVSPNDIANISVLKDASATAIYGARGANGVIIVTTKKGTAGDRSIVSFSSYYGTQEIVQTIPLANAREYAILANEAYRNETGRTDVPFPNPDALSEGTNWQDAVYQTAPIQNYNLSFSGSTERVSYTFSGDYFDQEGIIPGSAFQRLILRANTDYNVKDFLKIGHNLGFVYTDENRAPDVVGNTYRADPTVVALSTDGVYGNTATRSSVANPLAQLRYENDNDRQGYRFIGSVFADLTFLKNFVLRSSLGLNVFRERSQTFVPQYFAFEQMQRDVSSLNLGRFESNDWIWENTLTYSQEWTNVRLNLLGGITAQENTRGFFGASALNVPEDEALRYLELSDLEGRTVEQNGSSSSILSYLFRANATLYEKYLLTASVRSDGSSRFGENYRYGYFPSFAVGWRISEEPFMEDQRLFSTLKFRAGWGQTGNDQFPGGEDYPSKAIVQTNLFTVFGPSESLLNGTTLTFLSNPDLRWETNTQSNIGFELGFFNNRLSAEIDYYNRTTTDILWRVPIPGSVGLEEAPFVNAAEVRNTGFDFLLTWQERKNFGYNITLTGSTINNEVLRLSDGSERFFSGGLGFGGELGIITQAGSPTGSFFGYETDGVIQSQDELDDLNQTARELSGNPSAFYRSADTKPGDIKFRDINGDGVITGDDRTVLGSAVPDLVVGASLGADFKGFGVTVDFAGQFGNEIVNSKKMARFNTPNFERSYLDFWTPENTNTNEPRVTNSGDNYLLTPRFIEDGSFVSLRNVQLSYTLPTSLSEKLYLNNLRIYVAGSNLVYWTKYSGYTPEVISGDGLDSGIDRGIYPISRVYTFGLNASF